MKRVVTIFVLGVSIALGVYAVAAKDPQPGKKGCGNTTLKMEPKIVARVCKPPNVLNNTPAVILLPENANSDRDWSGNLGKKLATHLTHRNVLTIRIDMPGKGKSGKGPAATVVPKAVTEVAGYLKRKFGINPNKIFVAAHGKGATFMVDGAILQKKTGRPFRGVMFLDTASSAVPAAKLRQINSRAFIAQGNKSSSTSEKDSFKLKGMLGNAGLTRVATVDGMNHNLKIKGGAISYNLIIGMQEWMSGLAK